MVMIILCRAEALKVYKSTFHAAFLSIYLLRLEHKQFYDNGNEVRQKYPR